MLFKKTEQCETFRLSPTGDLLTGRIDGIVDECELHIETELCANADCRDKHTDECDGADR